MEILGPPERETLSVLLPAEELTVEILGGSGGDLIFSQLFSHFTLVALE